jgi:hypothetical protein
MILYKLYREIAPVLHTLQEKRHVETFNLHDNDGSFHLYTGVESLRKNVSLCTVSGYLQRLCKRV